MPTCGRGVTMDPTQTEIHHCISTTVRQARLCGYDPESGRDYEYRRQWIVEKVQLLASIYAIDVLFFAVMANHLHLVLKNLPQVVAAWSDEQVLERAMRAYPSAFEERGVGPDGPTPEQTKALLANAEYIAELRLRLADISWFMRQLNQYVAKRANAEDERDGHFWSDRYRNFPVQDMAGLVLLGLYVDLNQIRAGEAETPESSKYTSAYHRIHGLRARAAGDPAAQSWDGFMRPLGMDRDGQDYPAAGTPGSLRATDDGCFEFTLKQYLELLDWTARQPRDDKPGKMADDLPPLLQRVGLSPDALVRGVNGFATLFKRAIGHADSLNEFARQVGQKSLQCVNRVREALSSEAAPPC